MKQLKKYVVYLDDGHSPYKAYIPASSVREAKAMVAGNGEIIAVKDMTKEYPISKEKVLAALSNAKFGQAEISYMIYALEDMGIIEPD